MEMVLGLDMNRAGGGGSGRAIPSNVLTSKTGVPLQSKNGLYLTSKTGTTRMYIADYLNSITSTELAEVIASWRRVSPEQVLLQSSVAVTAPANDTNENILATLSLAAGFILANDVIRITTMWSMTASTNAKTLRVRLSGIGGTQFLNTAQSGGTTVALQNQIFIRFPTTATQKAWNAGNTGVFGTGTGAATTGTVDMTAATTLVITGQKATGSETLALESYSIELLRNPV